MKWSKEVAASVQSEAKAALFGSTNLNLNFFMQGAMMGEYFNIFINFVMTNSTGPPSTQRVFYQIKASLNTGLFLADQFAGVVAVAEL